VEETGIEEDDEEGSGIRRAVAVETSGRRIVEEAEIAIRGAFDVAVAVVVERFKAGSPNSSRLRFSRSDESSVVDCRRELEYVVERLTCRDDVDEDGLRGEGRPFPFLGELASNRLDEVPPPPPPPAELEDTVLRFKVVAEFLGLDWRGLVAPNLLSFGRTVEGLSNVVDARLAVEVVDRERRVGRVERDEEDGL
jgi:hypothetical protein